MNSLRVYLSGPMGGLTVKKACAWRTEATKQLAKFSISVLNPMRDEYDSEQEIISTNYRDFKDRGLFFTTKSIAARDFNDVKLADCLLINFLGTKTASLGTIVELAWAYALQKPAVIVIEAEGNPHDNHPLLHECMPFRAQTLAEGVKAVALILGMEKND